MRRMWVLIIAVVMAGCATAHPAPVPVPVPVPVPAPPPSAPPDKSTGPAPMDVKTAKGPVLNEIHFNDPQHGWVKGPGITLITADGGESWAPGTVADAEPVRQPRSLPGGAANWCDVTTDSMLAVSDTALLRSGDGGTSWEPVLESPLTGAMENGVLHCRAGAAWVLFTGTAGMNKKAHVVYRSADAGRHFAPMLSGATPLSLKDLPKQAIDAYPGPFDVVDATAAFFLGVCGPCGDGGTASITRTTDGGQTWQHDVIPAVREGQAISFVNARQGWIVARTQTGSRILATADGGQTWRLQYPSEAPVQ